MNDDMRALAPDLGHKSVDTTNGIYHPSRDERAWWFVGGLPAELRYRLSLFRYPLRQLVSRRWER